MSAEIPGSTPEFGQATNKVTDLVSKILLVTGHEAATSYMLGLKIGGYAREITLTALHNAGLLSPDFTLERFNEIN
jgi:hypothetical protein